MFSRSLKSIPLSPEVQALLGLKAATATPAEIMRAILKAEVDLLWFGGIGTYVRAPEEDDAAVGDRANDAIRVTAREVRAKVVGEGANLGVTQRGRIAYALTGGRINSDAIDNSAGVNSSDLEVNIKIALAPVVARGELDMPARNAFLASMTDEVAALCLRNNYLQTLALSLAERAGLSELPDQMVLIEGLEARGLLDRGVEFLPSDAAGGGPGGGGQGADAAGAGRGAGLCQADAVRRPARQHGHRRRVPGRRAVPLFPRDAASALRRCGGAPSAQARGDRHGARQCDDQSRRAGFRLGADGGDERQPGEVALAYAAVRDVYGLTALNSAIEALDGRIGGELQLSLQAEVATLLRQEALWFLRNAKVSDGLAQLVERHRAGVATLRERMETDLPARELEALMARQAAMSAAGVPEALARQIAELPCWRRRATWCW